MEIFLTTPYPITTSVYEYCLALQMPLIAVYFANCFGGNYQNVLNVAVAAAPMNSVNDYEQFLFSYM